jgi:hypothetical protein
MLAATVTERHTGAAAATIATAADAADEEASAAADLQRAECLRVCKCLHACCTQLLVELTLARLIIVAAPQAAPLQPGLQKITFAQHVWVTSFIVADSEAAQ